jgi:uncharacterized protein YacL (UPF0231 family)
MDRHYIYNGYEYRTWDDVEEDNIKTFHECYKDGQRIQMPVDFYNHSPYSYMTRDEFVKHVQTVEVFIQG